MFNLLTCWVCVNTLWYPDLNPANVSKITLYLQHCEHWYNIYNFYSIVLCCKVLKNIKRVLQNWTCITTWILKHLRTDKIWKHEIFLHNVTLIIRYWYVDNYILRLTIRLTSESVKIYGLLQTLNKIFCVIIIFICIYY